MFDIDILASLATSIFPSMHLDHFSPDVWNIFNKSVPVGQFLAQCDNHPVCDAVLSIAGSDYGEPSATTKIGTVEGGGIMLFDTTHFTNPVLIGCIYPFDDDGQCTSFNAVWKCLGKDPNTFEWPTPLDSQF